MVKILKSKPLKSLLVGFLAMVLVVPIVVFLAISLVGIPLIFIFIPVFLFLTYLSKTFVAFWLGEKIFFCIVSIVT